jgi:hypothetical protein
MSDGKNYMLVNPYIEGNIQKVFQADNSLNAAKKAYDAMSKYFNNSIHNFKFTLLKLKSDAVDSEQVNVDLKQYGGNKRSEGNSRFNNNNFSHFIVNEKINSNNEVSFHINKFNGSINNLSNLVNNVMKLQKKFKKAKTNGVALNQLSESLGSEVSTESSDSIQAGGKKKSKYDNDDDDEEDDSPDYYVKKSYYYDPITYWYYTPAVYPLDLLYIPTFTTPLSFPYVVDLNPSFVVTYP